MNAPINPITAHKPLGMYSHTMRIPPDADWLVSAGQVGVNAKGRLAGGVRQQAEQAFRNIVAGLARHGDAIDGPAGLDRFIAPPQQQFEQVPA